MKYIVDAQLPRRLAVWLSDQGIDCIHTLDLPLGNQSDDLEIRRFADQDDRVVISKDQDFWDDHLIHNSPKKLLIVRTGNIPNPQLISLFNQNFNQVDELFEIHNLIELNWNNMIVHG